MQVDYFAIAPELILTATICGVLLLDLVVPRAKSWLAMPASVVGVLATLAALLALSGERRTTLAGMFVVDNFAVVFKIVSCLSALLVLFISHDYLKGDDIHKGEYYTMILSSLLGMLTISSSRDLITIFVSLELVSLPTFVLAGLRKSDSRSGEAALKFFLFGVLSTAVMLFGMSIAYGLTGTTSLVKIAAVLGEVDAAREVIVLALFFIIAGLGFKVSAFPFQWWVPDTYEGAPVPVAAFLSVASKTAGFVGLLTIIFIGFGDLASIWGPFIGLLAVATMTFGNLVAIQQKHLVRMLAYSSVGQAGYILLPLGVIGKDATTNREAFTASILYLLIYAFMETGAFAVAVAVGKQSGYLISDYAGLSSRSPGLSVAMTAFLFSLAGVPPLAGWAAKFFVFKAVISGGGGWLAAIMAINTVIALFYYAAVVKRMYFEPSLETKRVTTAPLAGTAIGLSAVVVLIVGVLPGLASAVADFSLFSL